MCRYRLLWVFPRGHVHVTPLAFMKAWMCVNSCENSSDLRAPVTTQRTGEHFSFWVWCSSLCHLLITFDHVFWHWLNSIHIKLSQGLYLSDYEILNQKAKIKNYIFLSVFSFYWFTLFIIVLMLNFDETPLNSQTYLNVVNAGILWKFFFLYVFVSKWEVPTCSVMIFTAIGIKTNKLHKFIIMIYLLVLSND